MPLAELERAMEQFLTPLTKHLPGKRLGHVVKLVERGIDSSQSPLILQIALGLAPGRTCLLTG